jgi:hypothetical protein
LQKIGEAFREALEAARLQERSKPIRVEPDRLVEPTPPSIVPGPPKTGRAEKRAAITGADKNGSPPPLNSSDEDVEKWIRSVDADLWLGLALWGKRKRNFEWGEQRLLNDVAV